MLIDCDTCVARDLACGDCVVTVLLSRPALVRADDSAGHHGATAGADARVTATVEFDDAEQAAIDRLASAGLVPPLRLVRPMSPRGREIA